jgi:hypothetical protein
MCSWGKMGGRAREGGIERREERLESGGSGQGRGIRADGGLFWGAHQIVDGWWSQVSSGHPTRAVVVKARGRWKVEVRGGSGGGRGDGEVALGVCAPNCKS